ncbi:MAG: hypothetical protein ACRDN0_13765 [Trebonia sp.]
MSEAAAASPAASGWLGGTDHDARRRGVLRQAVPVGAPCDPGMCVGCLAAARTEVSHLAEVLRAGHHPDRRVLLRAGHLSDLVVLVGQRHTRELLDWQAGSLAAALASPAASPDRVPGCPVIWPWPRRAARLGVQSALLVTPPRSRQPLTCARRYGPPARFPAARCGYASATCYA